jgi:hypothetical protein
VGQITRAFAGSITVGTRHGRSVLTLSFPSAAG